MVKYQVQAWSRNWSNMEELAEVKNLKSKQNAFALAMRWSKKYDRVEVYDAKNNIIKAYGQQRGLTGLF